MADIKMEWTKPQLIVLARGMPEESVLVNCKTMNPNQSVQGRSARRLAAHSPAAGPDTGATAN